MLTTDGPRTDARQSEVQSVWSHTLILQSEERQRVSSMFCSGESKKNIQIVSVYIINSRIC